MAYERQYYTNGDVLDARQLNHMETGIKENSDNIGKLSEEIEETRNDLFNERLEYLVEPNNRDKYYLSDSACWYTNKLYKHGYIKSVSVDVGENESECTVYFYKDNGNGTATVVFSASASGTGEFSVLVDYFMEHDFYVGIKCPNCKYSGHIDNGYRADAGNSTSILIPTPETTFKFYHHYTIHMLSLNDYKASKKELENKQKISILASEIFVDNSYIENNSIGTVLDLPNNRIYGIGNDIDTTKFGLPREGHGTLLKYFYRSNDDKNTGYTVYEYTALQNSNGIYRYFAYAIHNQNIDRLIWHRLNYNPANKGINLLGLNNLSIVFIGDSIVEGYGSSDYNGGANGTSGHLIANNVKTWYRNTGTKCWANQMIEYLTDNYSGVTACNNAIGGFTTKNILDNLETLTVDDNGNSADVVILSIGTNNRNSADKNKDIVTPLFSSIQWMLARGIQPIILTNTPLMNTTNFNNAQTIQSAIIAACNESGVPCYDLLSRMNCYLWEHDIEVSTTTIMNDVSHPNDYGYEIMFHLIKQILRV